MARMKASREEWLEAAELAVDDLDAQLGTGRADVADGDLEVASHFESLGAGQALLFAAALLEDLDQPGDVACYHGDGL